MTESNVTADAGHRHRRSSQGGNSKTGPALFAVALLVSACGIEASPSAGTEADTGSPSTLGSTLELTQATETATVTQQPDSSAPAAAAEKAPDPARVRIPTISVDADIGPLGLRPDGTIDVPSDFAKTGWWADGPEPGDLGPAVILGHVDSLSGPAVFYDVATMVPGDSILVDRVDGSVATFVVERIEQHPKDDFPTDDVYGPTPDSQLRLVTCGGDFDPSLRSYRDNIIVFARLIGIAPSA